MGLLVVHISLLLFMLMDKMVTLVLKDHKDHRVQVEFLTFLVLKDHKDHRVHKV
jgi:hypothetical protein